MASIFEMKRCPKDGGADISHRLPQASTHLYEAVSGQSFGTSLYDWTHSAVDDPMESKGLPPGYWPGPAGAAEWGRRNGVGVRDARNRFYRGVKQHCPGSNPTDAFGVNPDTGDVVDPAGEYVDNLGDANSE